MASRINPAAAARSEPRVADAATISVVMPVYNGETVLRQSLEPLLAMRRSGEVAEVVVVDDGSTDRSAALAVESGARVVPSGGRLGPGGARNVAAATAIGDILWFVDADVVVHEDAARALRAAFAASGAAAVFGTYDDRPPGRNFLSQYKNLVHRFYHHREGGDADTFWAGCGAIRRDVFLAAGGFDAQRYPYPSIEDIELGVRLRGQGLRIVLAPELQGTHLKIWRLANLLHTDIARRALPWSRLIVSESGLPDALNVGVGERVNAILAAGLVLCVALAAARIASPWLALTFLAAVAVANARLFAFFRRARGVVFAVAAVAFHQLYYLYGSAVYAACWVEARLRRGQR